MRWEELRSGAFISPGGEVIYAGWTCGGCNVEQQRGCSTLRSLFREIDQEHEEALLEDRSRSRSEDFLSALRERSRGEEKVVLLEQVLIAASR